MSIDSEIFKLIKLVPNFPKMGINFRHIGPLLKNTTLFKQTIKTLLDNIDISSIDIVCGIDARGFILSTAVQYETGIPQVLIRKKSKLPSEDKWTASYNKEYGTCFDTIELEKDSIRSGQNVLIVDDLIATGSTIQAAIELIHKAGAKVHSIISIIEFSDLKPNFKDINQIAYFSMKSTNNNMILDDEVKVINSLKVCKNVKYDKNDDLPVLMWHPTLENLAKSFLYNSNLRPSYISWDYFPDKWPNIVFEPSDTLVDKEVIFLMNLSKKEIFLEQLALIVALPRQLIRTLEIVVPYLGPGTHERVEYSGQLATVEPLLKIISSSVPLTRSGPSIIRIVDIHALQTRFYINDNMVMKLSSGIPVLLQTIDDNIVIAFPDDGAYKRFKYFVQSRPHIVCSKLRMDSSRRICISDYFNWSYNNAELYKNVIIVDDLVQSGNTLIECAKALKNAGFVNISAYVTHAVFPNDSWMKFVDNDIIKDFVVSNTNPEVTSLLRNRKPFTVLDISEQVINDIAKYNKKLKNINRSHVN